MSLSPAGPPPLPELRQDLRLVGQTTDLIGNTLWTIYDPVRHRYAAISLKHYAMLDVWHEASNPEEIIESCWAKHAEVVSEDDVADLVSFLIQSGLAFSVEPEAWRRAYMSAEKYRTARLTRIMHSYLFFRIPLVDPQRFLTRTLDYVRPLGSRATATVLIVLALIALFFISREWEQFKTSAYALASWSGVISVLISIAFVKVLHELGHGYVAVNYGCRVPAMGVAFILGAPLLYVDVTDGWKLKSRRQRLHIDSAGIAVDLSVSILALFAWVFLPDGGARNAAFSLATAGWLTSLAFNLNPFMKFDGYHIMADGLSMPNMQERSIAIAKWKLRETLFGLGLAPPENIPRGVRKWLIAYGWALWIYRAILFTTIAIAVYHFFFKLLGILLFVVEIGYFIIAPIWKEIRQWGTMRDKIWKSKRFWTTASVTAAGLALLIIPWSTTVTVPAVLEPKETARVHVPVPARIVSLSVEGGEQVMADQKLLKLASIELDQQLELIKLRQRVIELRLARLASTPSDREQAIVLQQERKSLLREADGMARRMNELEVTAPITGTLTSLVEHVAIGRWVKPSEPLALVEGRGGARIRGLVDAGDISRVRTGMQAVFIPNDVLTASRSAVVSEIARANVKEIDQLELAATFGGPIASNLNDKGRPVPASSQYPLIAHLEADDEDVAPSGPQSGVLLVRGDPESLIQRFWKKVLQVLIRESGF